MLDHFPKHIPIINTDMDSTQSQTYVLILTLALTVRLLPYKILSRQGKTHLPLKKATTLKQYIRNLLKFLKNQQ